MLILIISFRKDVFMDNKDKNNKNQVEINTNFPMEFPSKNQNLDNHITEVVKNEINPPKSTNSINK